MPLTSWEAMSPSRVRGVVPGSGVGWAVSGSVERRASQKQKSRDRNSWGNMAPTENPSRQRRNGKLSRTLAVGREVAAQQILSQAEE